MTGEDDRHKISFVISKPSWQVFANPNTAFKMWIWPSAIWTILPTFIACKQNWLIFNLLFHPHEVFQVSLQCEIKLVAIFFKFDSYHQFDVHFLLPGSDVHSVQALNGVNISPALQTRMSWTILVNWSPLLLSRLEFCVGIILIGHRGSKSSDTLLGIYKASDVSLWLINLGTCLLRLLLNFMQIKFNSCGESSLSIEVWLIQLDETTVPPIITFFILSNSWQEVIVEGARVP